MYVNKPHNSIKVKRTKKGGKKEKRRKKKEPWRAMHQAESKWAPNLREQLIWFPKFSNFQLLKASFLFARIRRHLFFLSISEHKPQGCNKLVASLFSYSTTKLKMDAFIVRHCFPLLTKLLFLFILSFFFSFVFFLSISSQGVGIQCDTLMALIT